MILKLLSCEVFTREICRCMEGVAHVIDLEFTPVASHDRPESLREMIQDKIDAAEASGRALDAILLCYGLCGNALAGVCARSVPLVMPRAHDCATILLGSKSLFKELFGKTPSQPYFSRGHVEHATEGHVHLLDSKRQKQAYAEGFGKENADHLFESMNPHVRDASTDRVVYINIKPTESRECIAACREKAVSDKKEYVQLEGSLALIRNLMSGNWYPKDFLVVKPGRTIAGVYDADEVVRAC
jgi:hypothetical protein